MTSHLIILPYIPQRFQNHLQVILRALASSQVRSHCLCLRVRRQRRLSRGTPQDRQGSQRTLKSRAAGVVCHTICFSGNRSSVPITWVFPASLTSWVLPGSRLFFSISSFSFLLQPWLWRLSRPQAALLSGGWPLHTGTRDTAGLCPALQREPALCPGPLALAWAPVPFSASFSQNPRAAC